MENKVYYGEYTLKHWINMMLTGNIVLPDYQRHFVWRKKDVKRLLQSLSEGQFVQPVTIALYNDGTTKQNLILDGQQRLTSLLLAYLGYFPNKRNLKQENVLRWQVKMTVLLTMKSKHLQRASYGNILIC